MAEASCWRQNCTSYKGFAGCITSSDSPYAGYALRPDQVSTRGAYNAFLAFITKHKNCYANFCNRVCSDLSEEYVEQQKGRFFSRFKENKQAAQVDAIKKFCTLATPIADQFRFYCSFCQPYLKYGNTIIAECEDKKRKIIENTNRTYNTAHMFATYAVPEQTEMSSKQQSAEVERKSFRTFSHHNNEPYVMDVSDRDVADFAQKKEYSKKQKPKNTSSPRSSDLYRAPYRDDISPQDVGLSSASYRSNASARRSAPFSRSTSGPSNRSFMHSSNNVSDNNVFTESDTTSSFTSPTTSPSSSSSSSLSSSYEADESDLE